MHQQSFAVLCIEPDLQIQEQMYAEMQSILSAFDCISLHVSAESGLTQLHNLLLSDYQVPLVITEYQLPDMEGGYFLRHLKTIAPNTLQIVLSQQFSTENLINLINHAQPWQVLDKPLNLKRFKQVVRDGITHYQQQQKKRLFYATLENLIKERTASLDQTNQQLQREIQERRYIAESLQQSQQRLSFHIQHTPLAYIEWNLQGCVVEWNQAAEKIFGYSCEQAQGKHAYQLIVPNELQADFDRIWQTLLQEKISISNSHENVTRNGKTIYCNWYNTPLCNDVGEIIGIASLAQNITSQRTLLSALRHSENRFRTVVDQNPVGIIITDSQGIVEFVNPAYLKIYQCQIIDILGKHFTSFLPQQDQYYLVALYESLLKKQVKINNQELRLQNRKGQWLTILIDMVLVELAESPPKVITFTVDITKRKQTEEALRHSEANMRCYFEQPLIGIEVVDAQGRIINVNSRFCELLGYSAKQLLNMTWQQITHVDDLQDVHGLFQRLVNGQIDSYNLDKRYICQDGQDLHTHIAVYSVQPMTETEYAAPQFIAMVQDIGKRKQAEEKLQLAWAQAEKAQQEAEQANHAKSRFLANMSHELRTPLNAILGYTQLLQRDDQLTPPQQDGINVMHRNAEYLLSLINDMLDLSKIEVGGMGLQPSPFNLHILLNELAELFHGRALNKGIRFFFEMPPWLPEYVNADEKRLRQILINLLGNAIKFTQQGWVRLRVVCQASNTDRQCEVFRFQIEDTGVGIANQDLEQIFLPFQQADNQPPAAEGTGLGLAIVHKLVSLMNGQLKVSSSPNKGSTFWLNLKLPVVAHPHTLPHRTRTVIGYKHDAQQAPLRILITDDRLENRQILHCMLRKLGFELRDACHGQEAIDIASTWQPALILMDNIMPVMDGLTAVKQLRQLPALKHTKIIMVSASAFAQDQHNSLSAGCNDFISKPVQLEVLLDAIKTLLQLEWVYRTENNALVAPIALSPIPALTAIQYQLTEAQANTLRDYVLCGDVQAITEFAEQLMHTEPTQQPLANQLLELAKQFDMNRIRQLISQITDSHHAV